MRPDTNSAPRPLVTSLALVTALALSGCVESDDGAPDDDPDTAPALFADQVNQCHRELWFIDNNMNPTSQAWTYCVCHVQGMPDPGGWDLGGGWWTMPQAYCYGTGPGVPGIPPV